MRKHLAAILIGILALVALPVFPGYAQSTDLKIFRIGSGGVGGTYYPIAYLLASTISKPPGSRECNQGGSCGVTNLVAVPQSSNGSVSNIRAIQNATLESALAQSDIAYWGYSGTGVFEGEPELDRLRAMASLYPESIHVVVRKDSGINNIEDLRGKRISLDEPGSGTLVNAKSILEAYGLSESDLSAEYIKPHLAIEKMRTRQLDAFFIVVGYPAESITRLNESVDLKLIPIDGDGRERLLNNFPFFQPDTIPSSAYRGIESTATLSVTATWLVSKDVEPDLVYEIMRALWNDSSRKLLDEGHDKGKSITLISALQALNVPLHPGAVRFYKEQGMTKANKQWSE